ncbi:putative membrane protein SpoIIM required for sporulation [Microbacterium endophyticum]|uniref:Putative membrane protein SpoIIM required for sporulation n=1 Tax=Microbacterium endophyticum TaxID=1526412 RepID=A0A7W4V3P6_9MICO|nr:stage II sporulation protein M [Microbacterium endophyticum]MBB2976318.1 putative membrane protein SpoIIM required for sporulation [Microbacterium endophyticum]NIK35198.1 putative membrane protein SpoIIM required for sporulation [Microbacterium endophyticum]
MDLDALAAARRDEWQRLDELSRSRRLSGSETDELVTRYRAASADLADLKTSAGRSPQGDYLSSVIARARLQLTGAPENVLAQIPRFFALQLPAAFYRVRWTALAVAVGFTVIAFLVTLWISADPRAVAALGDRADLQQYAEGDFTAYYSENPAAVFAGTVWTNNAWIAAQCVLFGVTGLWPLMIVIQNAVSLGQAAAVMVEFDRLDVFFSFILPHGLLELTCVFVAAAAGLQIFWAWVAPGRRSRADALAREGRSLATVAIGLVFALALSGVVEGFVTGQPWPVWVKIALGAAALGVFLFYMLVIGARAVRAGESGDLTEYEAGTPRLVAG